MLVGWFEFNVPFQHKYGYIGDEPGFREKKRILPCMLLAVITPTITVNTRVTYLHLTIRPTSENNNPTGEEFRPGLAGFLFWWPGRAVFQAWTYICVEVAIRVK